MADHGTRTPRALRRRTLGAGISGALVALLGTFLAGADSPAPENGSATESKWQVSVFGTAISASGDSSITKILPDDTLPGPARQSLGDGSGFGLAVERRITRRFGLELTAWVAELDTDFRLDLPGATLTDTEALDFESLQLGLLYHFRPESRFDFHVGVVGGIFYYNDVTFLTESGRRDKFAFDDDTGFGLAAGLDYRLTENGSWTVAADVRFLSVILESEFAGQDVDADPSFVSVGIGYRF